MTTIQLEAWSQAVFELSQERAAGLATAGLVAVELEESPNRWRLVADSRIGVVHGAFGELRVRPRIAVPQLMFLLSYAADPRGWRDVGPAFAAENDLFTAVASAFAVHAERALSPSPLRGYLSVEDRSTTLRGRLRMADQVTRWPGQLVPLEVTYDDFNVDVPENRLVRGAADLLLRMPLLPFRVRRRLLRVRATLEEVSALAPGPAVAAPPVTRLNRRYAPAMALAELVLRSASISTEAGQVRGISFAFDMNTVFEDFLSAALKTSLERHGGRLELQYGGQRLDEQRRIHLIPDLTWWKDGACRAVVDAKYKALTDQRVPNADAYQMLAYCTALELDRGYLVYAKNSCENDRDHTINGAGKTIHVRAIDVERPPADVLAQVERLATAIARR